MKTNENEATNPLKQIQILLGTGLYWLNAEAEENHQNPRQEAEDCFIEAQHILNAVLKEKP